MENKKLITCLLLILIFGLPMFALISVNATVSWNPPIQVTNNNVDDFESVITYDPTATRQCHIAWVRQTSDELSNEIYYANSQNWSKHIRITIDDFKDENPMIDMDSTGVVHIVWVQWDDSIHSNIMYTNSTNFTVHVDISEHKFDVNWWPTLRVELATGIPHIAWSADDGEPSGDIYYKKGLSGTIQTIVNTPDSMDDSISPSIDLDANYRWHCVWEERVDGGDRDIRYINQTGYENSGAATKTTGYLNVSDIGGDNQLYDKRPDISVDMFGHCHVTWYTATELEVYYAVSPTIPVLFANLGPVTYVVGADIDNRNPSIKASSNSNPSIIFERDAQDGDIYATDFNSSWATVDISVNTWTDYLEMSSIGALDIDSSDRLFATYYTDVATLAPNLQIFVVTGSVAGGGIPGFEAIYLLFAFIGLTILSYLYKLHAKKLQLL